VALSVKSLGGPLIVAAAVLALLPAAAGAGQAVAVGSDMPAWSPDGQKLAFVSFRAGRVGDIYSIDPDGRGERRLTTTAAHEDMPRWSPDGRKIAFVRHTGAGATNFHIFVMNADGSEQTQLTHAGAANFAPTWSPDGSKIAFVSTRDSTTFAPNSEIYVMNADGSGERRLTTHPRLDDSPDWSPDGSLIAFASDRTAIQTTRIFVMRADGSEVRALTNHPISFHNELRPAWSRDGTTLAFVTERNPPVGNTEIYLVDADGDNSRRVTRNDFRDDSPTWAPDGRRLAVSRGPGALRPELYVIPVTGGTARKITGVNLRFVRLRRSAKRPRAGSFLIMNLTVRPALDRFADVACYAGVGRQLIEPELAIVVKGRLRCAWHVPRSAKGKRFYGFVAARAGGTNVVRSFSLRVR
jgi:Tol biopolymer transport system component